MNDREAERLAEALRALGRGDLDVRLPSDGPPAFAAFNEAAARLAAHVRGVTAVTRAVARGELPADLDVDADGEILALHEMVNTMLANLRRFAEEVDRVGREVGRPAPARELRVEGVAGMWKALTENLSVAEQAALVSRYKSELLATMTHELRTPLNSLLLLAKVLSDNRESNLTAKQVEYARTIYGSGGDLLSLVNDFLDLAKMESGMLQVTASDLEVAGITADIEAMFRPVAESQGLWLRIDLEGAPARVRTDRRRLLQILRNLVSNALKFTHQGGVTLRVRGGSHVDFAVEDTGIGIASDEIALVFEPFRQAAGTKHGGTGLGLTISRSLAVLLGGELRVESTPGQGSTFTLSLPMA